MALTAHILLLATLTTFLLFLSEDAEALFFGIFSGGGGGCGECASFIGCFLCGRSL